MSAQFWEREPSGESREIDRLEAEIAALRTRLEDAERERDALRVRARHVIVAADVDVGIARLSDDGLYWICPKCASPHGCTADCTRDALLKALDALAVVVALTPAAREALKGSK